MAVNAYIADVMTRHMVYLQRLAAGNVKDILPFLNDIIGALPVIIAGQTSPESYVRLLSIERELMVLMQSFQDGVTDKTVSELKNIGAYESLYVEKLLQGVVTVSLSGTSLEMVEAAVTGSKMALIGSKAIQELTIQEAVAHFSGAVSDDVLLAIRSGFVSGRTSGEIIKDVQALVRTRSKNQTEALVRTTTNHAASMGRQEFYKANAEVIAAERWVSTLDNRTTLSCIANDGKIFPVGIGPYPPGHWRCRSVRVAQIDPRYAIPGFTGERPQKGDLTGTGPVDSRTTYSGWLSRQSKEFQNEVLGPNRSEMFRSGAVKLDGFVDSSGITYTLKELRAKEGL